MHNLFTPSRPQKQIEAHTLAKSRKQVVVKWLWQYHERKTTATHGGIYYMS